MNFNLSSGRNNAHQEVVMVDIVEVEENVMLMAEMAVVVVVVKVKVKEGVMFEYLKKSELLRLMSIFYYCSKKKTPLVVGAYKFCDIIVVELMNRGFTGAPSGTSKMNWGQPGLYRQTIKMFNTSGLNRESPGRTGNNRRGIGNNRGSTQRPGLTPSPG
ncbi:hypothetical protein DPMN_170262 [Dreissena polymorpha]|uniref:Uncharacterized protein n=1 Tax=Dreissena polymorpha TaxID=45954 RepID=A0A9D4DY86_DREPO|nr:hypothetical protein DPMN_170262 [Dreissena polymorpha]